MLEGAMEASQMPATKKYPETRLRPFCSAIPMYSSGYFDVDRSLKIAEIGSHAGQHRHVPGLSSAAGGQEGGAPRPRGVVWGKEGPAARPWDQAGTTARRARRRRRTRLAVMC